MAKIAVSQDVIQQTEGKLKVPEIRVWCHPTKGGSDFWETFDSFKDAMAFIKESEDKESFRAEEIPLIAFNGLEINLWSIETE